MHLSGNIVSAIVVSAIVVSVSDDGKLAVKTSTAELATDEPLTTETQHVIMFLQVWFVHQLLPLKLSPQKQQD